MTHRSGLRRAPGGSAGRVPAWVFLSPLVVAAALVGAGAGYGLARGAWALPVQVESLLPGPLAVWLPKGQAEARSMPADLEDYAFELVEPRTKSGEALLKVRLVRKTTSTPVPDAVVFARRLDMAPDGMETMKTKLEPQPSPDPGIYAFKANLAMEGRWRLSLAAKVPGETGTVRDQLVFEAVE